MNIFVGRAYEILTLSEGSPLIKLPSGSYSCGRVASKLFIGPPLVDGGERETEKQLKKRPVSEESGLTRTSGTSQ